MVHLALALCVASAAVVIGHPGGYGGYGGDGGYGGLGGYGGYGGHGGYGGDEGGYANYKFEYGVHDPHTHDIKSQHEHRHGDHVNGGYSLKEADGTTRVVKYTSDPHVGFQAVVERIGHAQHPAHYGKDGHGNGYGGHGGYGGDATSWVGVTHWANQGHDGHHGY